MLPYDLRPCLVESIQRLEIDLSVLDVPNMLSFGIDDEIRSTIESSQDDRFISTLGPGEQPDAPVASCRSAVDRRGDETRPIGRDELWCVTVLSRAVLDGSDRSPIGDG